MNDPRRSSTWQVWVPLLVVLLVVAAVVMTRATWRADSAGSAGSVAPVGSSAAASPAPRATPAATPTAGSVTATPGPSAGPRSSSERTPDSGLPTVAESALPRQARETLRLIRSGGPHPHRQDGATFGNREGILPKRSSGYYREYTVETPGSPDRGPRRIVAGRDGDLYWTQDHYDHFRQIEEGR